MGQFHAGSSLLHSLEYLYLYDQSSEAYPTRLRWQHTSKSFTFAARGRWAPFQAVSQPSWLFVDRRIRRPNRTWSFTLSDSLASEVVSSWCSQEVCVRRSRHLCGAGECAPVLTRRYHPPDVAE